jgi:hypothetical protein
MGGPEAASDEAERKLAEAESRVRKAETKLRVTKDKLLRAEAALEKFRRGAKAENGEEKSIQPIVQNPSLVTPGLSTELPAAGVDHRFAMNVQIKLVAYGAVITLLLVALAFLGVTAYKLL